eukprot:Protomagalhaensia_wolfi_Nauph_80__1144@NODE_1674_length_1404_cov_103_794139_g1298_i0_p1_GENE_NODE_1674_length_1404_cov_103_794139_g1298_i0NODE_1674_length_1404_cov_103_794139_g1298_i0_p1_ORF_typecomplete_len398_score77_712Hacid_dh/PF00389_30/7_1e562Hacid_dh_C/PF02826_19/1_3e47NAD_binding_2/PF03446_15/5_4e07AlaDh_PNT_C/PF01262_21/14AlaDh_PNT_C/PF01262_21/0_00095Rossmannlike/PF10727_9/3_5e03Rossmannlike/PF10727_9/2e03Rossmannlike/PF10727_9/0_00095AdoHcyase_NAD/PF00670_21/6_1e03AdoHcyase_NAD/PF0067
MKVLAVLYPDPETGYPPKYARDSIPLIRAYPDSQTAPSLDAVDFKPGQLLGCVSGELGLRKYLESQGHTLVVTSDKEGENSEFERHLEDAEIVISQPFWPAYLTPERIEKASKLKLAVTAGIGSDHVNLNAAISANITVAEVTGSNSNSVAEHAVMLGLNLVRNFVESHHWVERGGWNIADCASRSYDIEGMDVGVIGAGRIGRRVLRLFKAFDVRLHYYDAHRLSPEQEKELNLTYHDSVESLVKSTDLVSIHCPLHAKTVHMFDKKLINAMRKGAYIVNTARAEITVQSDISEALRSGHLGGYAGDVWFPQPPPADHDWRSMPLNAMTPHVSGTSLSAQTRYAAGTLEILKAYLEGKPIPELYLIVQGGDLAGVGARSYSVELSKANHSLQSSLV